jgi:hypothetical protein
MWRLNQFSISTAACLLTLVTLTCLRPQWMLTPDLGRQLRLGQSIERRFQEMTASRRSQLLELLDPTSTRSLSLKP